MTSTAAPSLKILMLHGYTNTGAIFRAKTRALEKSIQKAFPASKLHYLDGPHRLKPSDIPQYGSERDPRSLESDDIEIESYAWWRRKDPPSGSSGNQPIVYAGFDTALSHIANAIRTEGPFDGVIGFSQGACGAGVVASLLEGQRRKESMDDAAQKDPNKMKYPADSFGGDVVEGNPQPFVQDPLKFAVIYSGFAAPDDIYGGLYEPKITTPTLHVIGSYDTIVDETRSRALSSSCENPAFFVHPGGHFCPSTKDALETVVGFIKAAVSGKGQDQAPQRGLGDEKVEDMDVPF